MVFISRFCWLFGLVDVIPTSTSEDSKGHILEDSHGLGVGPSVVWDVGAVTPTISNILWVWLRTGSVKGTNRNFDSPAASGFLRGWAGLLAPLHHGRCAELVRVELQPMGVPSPWNPRNGETLRSSIKVTNERRFQSRRRMQGYVPKFSKNARPCLHKAPNMLRSGHAWSLNSSIILNIPLELYAPSPEKVIHRKEIIRRSNSTRSSRIARWFVEALLPSRRT